MAENRAQRTLVKSPPELWAEISDAAALARRFEAFGEVRITRLEPETTVAWEGETARGTVELEPSGWGTKVTIAAQAVGAAEPEPAPDPDPDPDPAVAPTPEPEPVAETPHEVEREAEPAEPIAEAQPAPKPRTGFFARLFGRRRAAASTPEPVSLDAPEPESTPERTPEPAAQAEPEPQPEPVTPPEVEPDITATVEPAPEPADLTDALAAVLDGLGSANHRPFSRS